MILRDVSPKSFVVTLSLSLARLLAMIIERLVKFIVFSISKDSNFFLFD